MPEILAVGAVVVRDGKLLLVRRGHAPALGRWSVPGGHVEPGETDADAVVREVAEETGLRVRVGPLVGEVLRPGIGDDTYRIRDFLVEIIDGAEHAGDDASDLAWVAFDRLAETDLTDGLLDALREWAVVP
jgi:ADP-ribose pyrophosphatase YjhB (NUDIX family)